MCTESNKVQLCSNKDIMLLHRSLPLLLDFFEKSNVPTYTLSNQSICQNNVHSLYLHTQKMLVSCKESTLKSKVVFWLTTVDTGEEHIEKSDLH